tara:strand:- start:9504 stop:12044 length:2541 start_codon:yes stop_codon:yes gene_type:complete
MVNDSYSEYRFGGLNNADPRAGKGTMRAGNRANSGRSNIARARQERINRMKIKKSVENLKKKELNESNSNNNSSSTGRLDLGLFVYAGSFTPSVQSLKNLRTIIAKKVLENISKDIKIGSLSYKLIEVVGRDARFKKLFSVTSEYGLSYNRRVNLPQNTVFDFRIKISDGTTSKTGIITFFVKTGKVLVKGGYFNCNSANEYLGLSSQPPNLLASLWKMYGFSSSTLPTIKRGNTVASLRLGRKFDENELMRNLYGKNRTGNLEILRKSKPRAVTKTYFKFADTNHQVSITKKGVVQISFKGDISRSNLKMFMSKITKFPQRFSKYFKGKVKYEAPRTRISRRLNNQAAPNLTRRGTTCPPEHRPKPYSFSGKCPTGMYCRPNPQQQPCCYKKPKDPRAYKNKVKLAYNVAKARMPNNVANLFGISRNTGTGKSNISKNEPNIKIYKTVTRVRTSQGNMVNVNNIRIGSRQCLRYTKEKLLDFIDRLGHSRARIQSKSKQELCKIIGDLTKNTAMNNTVNAYIPTFKLKGKSTQLTLKSGKILMIGRRECSSFSRNDMLAVTKSLGISTGTGTTRPQMCELIEAKRKSLLNTNINRKIGENITKKLNRENAAVNRAAALKVSTNSKRDLVLYQMFITRIEPFVNKFEKFGSRSTVPSKSKFLGNFRTSVNLNMTRPVESLNARGWKKPFESWLREYVDQYKGAYTQKFTDSRNKAKANEVLRRQMARNKAKSQIRFSATEAQKDLSRFRNKTLDKNLRAFFDKKVNSFASNYIKFVTANGNVGTKASRRRAWFNANRSVGGIMSNYFKNIVSKIPPKYTGNNIRQNYSLNKNYRVVLGPRIKFERL